MEGQALGAAHELQAVLDAARADDSATVRRMVAELHRPDSPLEHHADGPSRPRSDVLPELRRAAAGSPAPWALPCVVKPAPADARVAEALSVVARELRLRRPDDHVETHILGGAEVSVYLDGHSDLRHILLAGDAGDGDLTLAVQKRCLERLLTYATTVDEHVQAALRAAADRAEQPRNFDYAGRLQSSTAVLREAVGASAVPPPEAWDALAALCERPGGRVALFYDPKPANFLVLEATAAADLAAAPLHKIDIDWMLTRAPVAHQALVAVLSQPVRAHSARAPRAILDELWSLVCAALPAADADEERLDALIVYHLYRNFASKLGPARAQAAAIRPFLLAAIERCDAVEVPAGMADLVEACERLPATA